MHSHVGPVAARTVPGLTAPLAAAAAAWTRFEQEPSRAHLRAFYAAEAGVRRAYEAGQRDLARRARTVRAPRTPAHAGRHAIA